MQAIPFDEREGVIWFDGKLIDWKDAKTHVINQGLHYAGSVFEGCRAYNGKIFKNLEHCARLRKSAELIGFEIPYTPEELAKASDEVIAKNGFKEAYIRPFAFRGSKIMGVAGKGNVIHTVIAAWQWPNYFSDDIKERGLKLCWASWKRPSPETAPSASKAAGLYMIATLAKDDATSKGYDDALMLDYRGYIAEATAANIFFLINGEIHTPLPDCFLNGITRLTAIDLLKARGIKVVERHIKPEEIEKATEVFVTGTAAEITPIGQIGDYKYKVGELTKSLMDEYAAMVRGQPFKAQKVA